MDTGIGVNTDSSAPAPTLTAMSSVASAAAASMASSKRTMPMRTPELSMTGRAIKRCRCTSSATISRSVAAVTANGVVTITSSSPAPGLAKNRSRNETTPSSRPSSSTT